MTREKAKLKKTPPAIVSNRKIVMVYLLWSRAKRKAPVKKVKGQEEKVNEASTSNRGRKQGTKTTPTQSPIVRSPSPPLKKHIKISLKDASPTPADDEGDKQIGSKRPQRIVRHYVKKNRLF